MILRWGSTSTKDDGANMVVVVMVGTWPGGQGWRWRGQEVASDYVNYNINSKNNRAIS